MRTRLLTLLLGVLISGFAVAQKTVNDYHYIQIPQQFEFLKGKDQYQVNSLVRFLFKKHGFNAYMGDELPIYLRKQPCKGLYADVQGTENFMFTKILINIKDCYGNIVFTSAEGKSKEKDYRKAYHGAIREAFVSIEELNVNQLALPELSADTGAAVTSDQKGEEVQTTEMSTKAAGGEAVVPKEKEMAPEVAEMVKVVSLSYEDYELLKDGPSYKILYRGERIGSAVPASTAGEFTVTTSQFTGMGFEGENSFRLERHIEGLKQTVTMLFKPKE